MERGIIVLDITALPVGGTLQLLLELLVGNISLAQSFPFYAA